MGGAGGTKETQRAYRLGRLFVFFVGHFLDSVRFEHRTTGLTMRWFVSYTNTFSCRQSARKTSMRTSRSDAKSCLVSTLYFACLSIFSAISESQIRETTGTPEGQKTSTGKLYRRYIRSGHGEMPCLYRIRNVIQC